jgi:hypothetical protein
LGSEELKKIGTVSTEHFMLHFYEEVRVLIDWKSLNDSNSVADCFEIESRDDLGDLYTVWGMNADKTYTQNHSLRVKDNFTDDCEKRLNDFSKEFLGMEVVLIAAPVYKCHCNKYVLLDRTHRSISLYRAKTCEFRMIIYAIDAQFIKNRQNCNQCSAIKR